MSHNSSKNLKPFVTFFMLESWMFSYFFENESNVNLNNFCSSIVQFFFLSQFCHFFSISCVASMMGVINNVSCTWFKFISHELQAKPIVGDNKWNWTIVILSTSSWGKVWTTMLFLKRLAIWNWWPMYIEINNSQPHSLLLPSLFYSHNCHPFLHHCHFFFINIYPFYTIIFFPLSAIFSFLSPPFPSFFLLLTFFFHCHPSLPHPFKTKTSTWKPWTPKLHLTP